MHKVYVERGASILVNTGTRHEWPDSFTGCFTPGGKPPMSVAQKNGRATELELTFGGGGVSPLPGFKPRNVQPLA
jgi:hypothetical protein